MNNCNSILLNTMGHGPVQLALSAAIIVQGVLASPARADAKQVKLHAWLQDHAWTESEIDHKLAIRPFQGEPCFCYETTLKLFYFVNLVYDIDEVSDSPFSKDIALGLYASTDCKVLWKEKEDAKCFAAWSRENKTIVLAFRGTASMANVKADIKVWRKPVGQPQQQHTHRRGRGRLFGSRPMVHSGFLLTWEASGLKHDVMTLLKDEIIRIVEAAEDVEERGEERKMDGKKQVKNQESGGRGWRLLLTGHSLGGALAHLASFDIAQDKKLSGCFDQLTCVTFGAPRPGNHAFARAFRQAVPDAWDVFHSDDPVAVGGKFIFLYKRAAHTVIVSRSGELLVRPTPAEKAVRRGFTPTLPEHLLSRYARSLGAILRVEIEQEDARAARKMKNAWEDEGEREEGEGEEGSSGPRQAVEIISVSTSSAHALRELCACEYISAVITSTGGLRQVSLMRLRGVSPEGMERAEVGAEGGDLGVGVVVGDKDKEGNVSMMSVGRESIKETARTVVERVKGWGGWVVGRGGDAAEESLKVSE